MHIPNTNTMEIKIRQQLLLPSNMKSYLGVRLAYLHLALTNSKGEYQGHAHFDFEYLENGNL